MKRRGVGRSRALSARMLFALFLLALTYAAVAFGIYELFNRVPRGWPYWSVLSVALGVAIAAHYRDAGKTLLTAARATAVEPGSEPTLEGIVTRLAALAGIPTPVIAIADTDDANAFAFGLSQRRAVVVLTRGLRDQLTEEEQQAVLAHELAHVANRDAAVLSVVAGPRMLGQVMVGDAGENLGLIWLAVWPVGLPIYAIGALLTLTVSRYREFAADRGSAMLTGAPEQLMSALQKLSSHATGIPHEDLRAANVFCIVPTEATRISVFSDHPPLEKRLAALAEIAREMGKPVS